MRRILFLMALLALWSAGELVAQDLSARPGNRIRVTAPAVTLTPTVGRLIAIDADTLLLRQGKERFRFLLSDVELLEVSRGRKNYMWEGIAIGALVGGLLAYVVFKSCKNPPPDPDDFLDLDCDFLAPVFAISGALGGAGVGFIVGLVIQVDRWRPAAIHTSQGFYPPSSRSIGLSLTLKLR